jgi:hypothetical protein
MMTRENVLRKISALKRLAAAGSGATPHERETAGRLATKLVYEHDVSLHELAAPRHLQPDEDMSGVVFTWSFSSGNVTNSTTFSY